MTPEDSRKRKKSAEPAAGSLWRAAGYVAALVAAEIACYELALSSFTSCWLPPLVAEAAFLGAEPDLGARSRSYRSRLLGRCAGILLASLIIYFAYIIPVVYHERTPWDEEGLWRAVIVAAQSAVAAGVSLVRWLIPRRTSTHPD